MIKPVYNAHGITLYQGEAEDIMRELLASGQRFGALVTDPPYCSGGATAREREEANIEITLKRLREVML